MAIPSIGVRQILPRTGTGAEGANPPPDQNNDSNRNDAPSAPDRAPAEPGTGQVVDRIA